MGCCVGVVDDSWVLLKDGGQMVGYEATLGGIGMVLALVAECWMFLGMASKYTGNSTMMERIAKAVLLVVLANCTKQQLVGAWWWFGSKRYGKFDFFLS